MPVLQGRKPTKYRAERYNTKTGEALGQRIVEVEPDTGSVTADEAVPNGTVTGQKRKACAAHNTDRRPRKKTAAQTRSRPESRLEEASSGPTDHMPLTISNEDYEEWREVLKELREKGRSMVNPMTKKNVETLLSHSRDYDIYNLRHCELRGYRKASIIYSADLRERRLRILACRVMLVGQRNGKLEQWVATRTGIRHRQRTGRSAWNLLKFHPEGRIYNAAPDLWKDVPDDDDISYYEYPLKVEKKMREADALREKLESLMQLHEGQDLLLGDKFKEIAALKKDLAHLRRVGATVSASNGGKSDGEDKKDEPERRD
ncbi:hypothetical protein ACRE_051770 [Hapsidospora chrysogenum ATCC 11550]|uniref:Uncharacterized protein n=1 Tax=Hapsidospora chrysogenum (strain ATCC 11550 / CBS 779.69 / DSM 880 / IAM 14645 / JCM 23072 / IMI 49137) TaxID=857340 RepID=A0A086T3X0_HAPC1|nr:hypothetical protein ACRE_051770 [Hapsidospora chrysogenum ATCC 11550]